MIQSDKQFDSYQLLVILLCSMVGAGVLQLPAGVAESTGSESWIVVIIGGILTILCVFLICKAGSVFNGEGLVDASKTIFGKVLGTILVLPIPLCLFIGNCVESRIFSITVKVFLLRKTPYPLVLIPFILIVMFLIRGELKHIIRFLQFVLPFIVVIIVALNILTIPGTDITNLLPVLQKKPSDYLDGLLSTIFSFLGIVALLALYPYLKKRDFKSTFKISFIGVASVAVMYTAIVILCLGKLGIGETKWYIYPTVSLIKSASVPGGFLERLEGILMCTWVVIEYSTMAITVYAMAVVIADIFKFKSTRHIVTILIPLIYMLSASFTTSLDILEVSEINNIFLGLYSMFVFPALLYIVYKIKKRKRGVKGD